MYAIIPLVVSIVGIIGLVLVKQWELRRGNVPWSGLRTRLDARAERLERIFSSGFPNALKYLVGEVTHAVAYHSSAAVLFIVRVTERRLFKLVNMIKGRREIRTNGSSSTFLKDVSEHRDHLRRSRNGASAQ
jgi:hypothetical protein